MIPYLNFEWGPLFKALLNPRLLRPRLVLPSLAELDPDFLRLNGIRAVVLDLDQTLCRHGHVEIHPPLAQTFAALKAGFKVCLLTNPPRLAGDPEATRRYQAIQSAYGVTVVVPPRKKPHPAGFEMALWLLGAPPRATAMVGDRVLTDILGANLLGMFTVLVDPIDTDDDPSWLVSLPRRVELLLLKGQGKR